MTLPGSEEGRQVRVRHFSELFANSLFVRKVFGRVPTFVKDLQRKFLTSVRDKCVVMLVYADSVDRALPVVSAIRTH